MSEQNLTSDQKQVVKEVYLFAAEMLRNHAPRAQIEMMLSQRGIDGDTVAAMIADIERRGTTRNSGRATWDMVIGAFVCIVGVAITCATYSAAASSPSGGRYFIASGAIALGGHDFLKE